MATLDGPLLLSIVSRVELEGGVHRVPADMAVRRSRLDAMLAHLPILAFDDAAADAYGRIVAATGYSRRLVLDRMIAAHALVTGATLLTANGRDFRTIPGLVVQDW